MKNKRTGSFPKFAVDVNERGARFVEEVIIDKERNVEIFSVPQHNNVDESHLYIDLNKGLLVQRFPKTNVCHLRTTGNNFPDAGDLETGLEMEHHLKSEDKVEPDNNIVHHYRFVGSNIVDRSFLGREMAQFCEGAEMFWAQELEEVISVHEETNPTPPEPRNETIVPGRNGAPSRQRRAVSDRPILGCPISSIRSACAVSTKYCHYFRVCKRNYNNQKRAYETVCNTLHQEGTNSCCIDCCLDGNLADPAHPACSRFKTNEDVKKYGSDTKQCPHFEKSRVF